MNQVKIEAILKEAEDHGLAFVEDDWLMTDDGDEIYNPVVDKETAMAWLLDKLSA